MALADDLKAKLMSLSNSGIPVILFRDVIGTKEPSITFSLLLTVSLAAILSLSAPIATKLGLQYDQCKDLLMYVSLLYLGRKYQKGDLTVSGKDNQ